MADLPGNPLLAGVSSFDGGSSSFRNPTGLAAGATQVAHWSDGTPLVAFKGRVVGLNFFPPSSDVRSDFWKSSTDGVRLMTNALGATLAGSAAARGGYCSVKGNTNPFTGAAIPPGTFLDLTGGQVANDANYTGAVPANYLQGLGITCDVLPGYVKTGETVGYFGHGDPGMYTYYAKAG